jgi:UDP-glucose 4-epimerase
MKVLVTGGAGFIGSHVVERLIEEQHYVFVVDSLISGHERNLPPDVEFYKVDIRDPHFEEVLAEFKPHAIMHLAAQMDVRKSVDDPIDDADVNVLGTVILAQAALKAGVEKIIFSSTGGAIYGEQDFFPATEDHPLRPASPYGTAKLCAEEYLKYFSRIGDYCKCINLRYANVYGPRQDPHGEAGVVAIFIEKLLANAPITINGDGKQTRDFVYVDDVVNANLLALHYDGSETFNIGTGIETDINTIAGHLVDLIGTKYKIQFGPHKSGEQLRSSIDSSLSKRKLGWEPSVSLEDGLRKTVQFFRERKIGG